MTWKANILTLYPEIYPGYLSYSLLGKALEKKIWELNIYNLRDFGDGKHKTVDDKPFGGGAGMIIKPDILGNAIEETLIKNHDRQSLVYLSPKGRPFKQIDAKNFSQSSGVSILCGHFEGIDQRVLDIYEIEAECGGGCSCATCHVYIQDEWVDKLDAPTEMEEDMLDFAIDVKENSRLSCQIKIDKTLDGITIQTPEKQF